MKQGFGATHNFFLGPLNYNSLHTMDQWSNWKKGRSSSIHKECSRTLPNPSPESHNPKWLMIHCNSKSENLISHLNLEIQHPGYQIQCKNSDWRNLRIACLLAKNWLHCLLCDHCGDKNPISIPLRLSLNRKFLPVFLDFKIEEMKWSWLHDFEHSDECANLNKNLNDWA